MQRITELAKSLSTSDRLDSAVEIDARGSLQAPIYIAKRTASLTSLNEFPDSTPAEASSSESRVDNHLKIPVNEFKSES